MIEELDTKLTHTLIMDAIRRRRSYSLKYLCSDPIPLEDVQLMLEAANWAPSHGQTEPWRFTVFANEGRQQLSDAFGEAYRLHALEGHYHPELEQAQRDRVWQAPVWISIGMQPAMNHYGEPLRPEWEEIISVGIAVHSAQLVASSLGLGSKWSSSAISTHPHVAHLVGLEPPARLLGFLYVGKPTIELPPGTRRPISDKVRWVTEDPDR
jgi:nitroreductase